MYYSKQFDTYIPEAVRITGRPLPKLPPGPATTYAREWQEIEALEDAGEIYVAIYERNRVIKNREASRRRNLCVQ